jgi:hypothetical protein
MRLFRPQQKSAECSQTAIMQLFELVRGARQDAAATRYGTQSRSKRYLDEALLR